MMIRDICEESKEGQMGIMQGRKEGRKDAVEGIQRPRRAGRRPPLSLLFV